MGQLIEELKGFATLMPKGTPQGDYFNARYEAAKDVKVCKCSEVLTEQQIRHIKRVIRPQKKECHKNAALVAQYLNCEFCDGLMLCYFGIEHSFNKVGDKYIDVTAEFALGNDPTAIEYVSYGEYSAEDALAVICDAGMYTSVFNEKFARSLKKR